MAVAMLPTADDTASDAPAPSQPSVLARAQAAVATEAETILYVKERVTQETRIIDPSTGAVLRADPASVGYHEAWSRGGSYPAMRFRSTSTTGDLNDEGAHETVDMHFWKMTRTTDVLPDKVTHHLRPFDEDQAGMNRIEEIRSLLDEGSFRHDGRTADGLIRLRGHEKWADGARTNLEVQVIPGTFEPQRIVEDYTSPRGGPGATSMPRGHMWGTTLRVGPAEQAHQVTTRTFEIGRLPANPDSNRLLTVDPASRTKMGPSLDQPHRPRLHD